jgi:uncharacterized membrane protein
VSVDRRIELTYLGLALVGLVVAGMLTSFHVSAGASQAFCTEAGGCGTVNESSYSQVLGVPISVFGMLSYGTIAILAALAMRGFSYREWVPLVVFGIAASGTLYSIYLTYLELFVIHAICPWCVASAIVMVALLVVSLADLLRLRPGVIPVEAG